MYASNEDEYNREDSDWVFLRQTSPTNIILGGAVNLIDHEQLSSSSSISSLSSPEHEHIQNDNQIDQEESLLLNEDPVSISQCSNDNTTDLLSTGEIKEEGFSTEVMIDHENETTPVINEYDLFNAGFDLGNESIPSSNNVRRRTGANVQQTVEQSPSTMEHERSPSTMNYHRPSRNNTLIVCGVLILFFTLQLIFGRFVLSQQLINNKMTDELKKINQRLDEIKINSMKTIEQKLTNQFEEKINQKLIELDNEKYSLILQINELYHIIDLTKQNLTSAIHQLSDENERLQGQVNVLEQRLQTTEEQDSKDKETCPEGVDCTKSSFDVLLSNLIKQSAAIAEDTSVNLSGLFEQLSGSLSDFVEHRHEFLEESKRKLTDLTGSQTAEDVQNTLRRGMENLSSSLREAQSTYTTWIRSRAQHREQARMENMEQEQKINRRPWRWTFRRGHDREQMRHQIPVTTKHSSNRDYVCHSQYEFPVNRLCTVKNWMERFFRP